MQIENVFVQSLGSYLPEPVSVDWAVEQGLYDPELLEYHFLRGTLVAGDTSPSEMAVTAARTAMERAGAKSTELDAVLHASVFQPGPGGWSLPGHLLNELGGGAASVVEFRQGCNGMLTAMEMAVGQMTGAQGHNRVLLTAADNFEHVLNRWECEAFIAGDAGSAALLGTGGGFARLVSMNAKTVPQLEAMHRGSDPLFAPPTAERLELRDRLTWFADNVMPTMEAAQLMSEAYSELTLRSLADAGIGLDQLTKVVYNNVSVFLLKHIVLDPLGIEMDRSTWEYGKNIGHLGASDFVVSLEHLLLRGELKPGDHVLLIGGAPGFYISTALLEILEIPEWAAHQ